MPGILLGGSSHCGKSTLATRLGAELGWTVLSTDKLGRHPGRPWMDIPQPVEEFYDTLSEETIYWFLRVHHQNMVPLLEGLIKEHVASGEGFVLEGSALRPELIATQVRPDLHGMLLTADPDLLVSRIHQSADYANLTPARQRRTDRFITRSMRDQAEKLASAATHGVEIADLTRPEALDELIAQLKLRLLP